MGIVLDINTPLGQRSLAHERRAASIIKSHWDCEYLKTPPKSAAVVDAIILRDDIIAAVAETKCREMTEAQLRGEFNNTWLVTLSKVLRAVDVASMLCVPLWGILYLIPDDVVLRIKIWSPDKQWLVPFSVGKTFTQATINGGEALRDNAYIHMGAADVLQPPPTAAEDEEWIA
jgi:hypothetical protein